MIKALAQFFRGVHLIMGISEPSPGTSDRMVVFAWLGSLALVAVFLVGLLYIIPSLYFGH